MVVVVVGMRTHTVAVAMQQEERMLEDWLPGEVRMVFPIRVICVVVLGIGWWLVLAHNISLFSHHIP